MKKLLWIRCATMVLALTALVRVCVSCAHVAAGNDPVIVQAERVETVAISAFDSALAIDNSNRPFWKTNLPGFHQFCESLRQPVTVDGTNLPKGVAIVKSLDAVKLQYKASKVNSNAVLSAIATLDALAQQAGSWLFLITNKPN